MRDQVYWPNIPDNDSTSVGLRTVNWERACDVFKLKLCFDEVSLTCGFLNKRTSSLSSSTL